MDAGEAIQYGFTVRFSPLEPLLISVLLPLAALGLYERLQKAQIVFLHTSRRH
jgi:hypothetical protein